jgi:hypothetical protein
MFVAFQRKELCMRRNLVLAAAAALALFTLSSSPAGEGAKPADWSMNATIIEACSCPMFCQCYFNTKPAGHHAEHGEKHYCKFNNAFKVNKGNYGSTKLDGAKFWISGDLGEELAEGKFDWAVLTFDPAVTKEQREGIVASLGHIYPVTWNSFEMGADAPMEWNATADRAVAKLNGGKTAEVVLNRFPGMSNDPIVIKNLRYFGVPRNDGFLMMPNEVQAYRIGPKAYETKGTNGFMITIDMNSKDVKPAAAPAAP